MAKFDVVDLDLKKVREIELPDAVFGAEANPHLFYEVAKFQAINRRRGTVGVKNTSLVRGGGKKPYKQKGTGRARQGSIRASQWVGGGKAMAPKSRDYTYRPPKKVRRGAICAALSQRVREKALIIVDTFPVESGKSKAALDLLTRRLKLKGALVVDERKNTQLHRSVRNLVDFDVLAPEGINLESVLKHPSVVLTSAAAQAIGQALEASAVMIPTDVIKGPLITEKLDQAREKFRHYSFLVDREATKHDVARAVETLFAVTVEAVRTTIIRGKVKRVGRNTGKRPNYKKAIVTLKVGDKIDLFEGGVA